MFSFPTGDSENETLLSKVQLKLCNTDCGARNIAIFPIHSGSRVDEKSAYNAFAMRP
jgi:hypothetical protein